MRIACFPALLLSFGFLICDCSLAQVVPPAQKIDGWQMQDASKVQADTSAISTEWFKPQSWYPATVPRYRAYHSG